MSTPKIFELKSEIIACTNIMWPTQRTNGVNESRVSTESVSVFADFYGLWALLSKQYF